MSDYNLETFEEIVQSIDKRCRTCLKISVNLSNLSTKIHVENHMMSLLDLISDCTSIVVSNADGFPQQICGNCEETAIKSRLFKIQCELSQKYLESLGNKLLKARIKLGSNISSLETNYGQQEKCKENGNILSEDCLVTQQSKEEKPTCNCCNKTFSNKRILIKHFKTKYLQLFSKDKQIEENKQNVGKHTCPLCDKNFEHRSSMLRHQKRHNAPPKSCLHCTFKPTCSSALSKHMEEEHSHLKAYNCKQCDKRFFKKTNLHRHLQVHEGVKRHVCEVCGTRFIASSNLLVHKRLHTGEKPYTCSWCGRGFTQHSALRSHEAGHLDNRDHVCPECGVAFSRAGALRNHRKRHSTTKLYECSICGHKFTFSSERKRHMLIHSGTKNFKCDICGGKFTRNNNLKVHMKIHTGETPHMCHICGKGFIQARCLKIHLGKHAISINK